MHLRRGNLFLVGMPGSGKSTLGRVLARSLGKTFVDADHELERRLGVTISTIFEIEGEEAFRAREEETLARLVQRVDIVLATGGGAVLRAINRERLRAGGTVLYLHATPETTWERTRHSKNRPLLQTADPLARARQLYAQRDHLYRETADLVIEAEQQKSAQVLLFLRDKLDPPLALPVAATADNPPPGTMNRTVNVALGERSYPIHIGDRMLDSLPAFLGESRISQVALVTNSTVAALLLEKTRAALVAAGFKVMSVVIPDGEAHKTIATWAGVHDQLLAARLDRKSAVVALGGGVVGDIAGFAAATYQRGIALVQIPTTLLSQVDSSVGGKTGVNHPLGKNMIGAFHQPMLVVIDTATLATLPERELRAGLAEVIKYGLLGDAAFFDWLEANMPALLARNPEALAHAIEVSCRQKAGIVGRDETEQGERALLNLGHTFGHAIESGLGYGAWLHGEAIAAGTVLAARLSHRLGWLATAEVERIVRVFVAAGLPVEAPALGAERYLELMMRDKKTVAGNLRLILLKGIGAGIVADRIPIEEVRAVLP